MRYIRMIMLLILTWSGLICTAQLKHAFAQENRWSIQKDGSIIWKIDGNLPHEDHIEMAGEKVALWVKYGLDKDGSSSIFRTVVFPTFRTLPVDTHSNISYSFTDAELPRFYINNRLLKLDMGANKKGNPNIPYRIQSIQHHGIMEVNAEGGDPQAVQIKRKFFPSVERALAIEEFKFTNTSKKDLDVSMEYIRKEIKTLETFSTPVSHFVIMGTVGDGTKKLKPGESADFAVYYLATNQPQNEEPVEPEVEETKRINRIAGILHLLQLETPDITLNTAFDFAKIRATESIYKTKGGYMHGPGGLTYYAAIWANDQAEYVNPFFAFLGDSIGNLSAMNSYGHFARFMNKDFKPLPSSIIAEGDSTWQGAGDRGDAAMIAYGASRYALTYGNIDSAKKLWPLIKWCLEYNHRKLNDAGVVLSDKDELEGRFPAGKANLSTSSLYYDALRSSAMLAKFVGESSSVSKLYQQRADQLEKNIEQYFGAEVEGFHTYRYYEGNTVLRAWISLPLVMGIDERKNGTIAALFSPRLWTTDGLATQAGEETFWDRSTLYALRGVLQAGETKKAMDYLKYYSNRRLLGEHVPYPVEAYPEGNQRHLSAESGLYCRIFIEGLFGIRPTGLNTFNCTPRLPEGWKHMALKNIHAFNTVFSLSVDRIKGQELVINIDERGKPTKKYEIIEGQTGVIKF